MAYSKSLTVIVVWLLFGTVLCRSSEFYKRQESEERESEEQESEERENFCVANGVTYEEGDSYTAEDGCNTCLCFDNGEGALVPGCTRRACPPPTLNLCVANGTEYEDGDEYVSDDGCNTCWCQLMGTGDLFPICTEMTCDPFEDVEPASPEDVEPASPEDVEPAASSEDVEPASPEDVEPASSEDVEPASLEDRRQTNECVANGRTYEVGDSYTADDGCNTCMCTEGPEGELLPACTRRACPPIPEEGDASDEEGDVTDEDDDEDEDEDEDEDDPCTVNGVRYEPGDSFIAADGCNRCFCGENLDGERYAACTLMACPAGCIVGEDYYEPGTSYPHEDGCNTCTCEGQGRSTCTEMDCEP